MGETIRDFAVSKKEMRLLTEYANANGLPVVFERFRDDTFTASVRGEDFGQALKVLDAKKLEFSIK